MWGRYGDLLFDLLFRPSRGMRALLQEPPVAFAAAVGLGGLLWTVLAIAARGGWWSLWGWAIGAGGIATVGIGTWLWHFSAMLFGCAGSMRGLFAALCLAQLPRLLLLPILALADFFAPAARVAVVSLAGLLVVGWSLFLCWTGIRVVYAISGQRASWIMLFPALFLLWVWLLAVMILAIG